AARCSATAGAPSRRRRLDWRGTGAAYVTVRAMQYLDFLSRLHEAVEPRGYLEIGLRHGDSLALARCPALGVDPGFNLRVPLGDNVTLLEETSDELFDRAEPLAGLGGAPLDLAFIDGM